MVLAPHPDDETLACGGTIVKKIRSRERVKIVFLTDGRNSHLHALGIGTEPGPEEVAAIREQEAVNACGVLGVPEKDLVFLRFEDGTLNAHVDEAAARVAALMSGFRPDEIYYPDQADSHRDHRAAYEAIETALKSLSFLPAIFRYVIWVREGETRPELPFKVDVREELPVKRRALDQYFSQVTLYSPKQERPVLLPSFAGNFLGDVETFIRG